MIARFIDGMEFIVLFRSDLDLPEVKSMIMNEARIHHPPVYRCRRDWKKKKPEFRDHLVL